MVTLNSATSRDSTLAAAVNPVLAPADIAITQKGDFTICEVMFTIRPNRRCFISPDHSPDHHDRGEHVGFNRGEPVLILEVLPATGRGSPFVIDEDVGIRASLQNLLPSLPGVDVGRHLGHFHTGGLVNLTGRAIQVLMAEAVDRHIHTLPCQRHGAGPSQTPAGSR